MTDDLCGLRSAQGRYKLFGTITYPTAHYITLDLPRGQASVACEDCFDCLVLFSQAWWVGSQEENPEERRLDMPPSLAQVSTQGRQPTTISNLA